MRKSVAAVVAASATLAGCQMHEGSGRTVSRSYSVGNFQGIEVAGPYEVDVRTGANPSVSANGSERLLDRTTVEVKDGKLRIRPEEHMSFFNFGWHSHGKATFTVTVPQLNGATIAGSGDIHVDRVSGQRFEGAVAGSGGLNLSALDVQQLKLTIAGSGGAKAIAGKAQSAEYSIVGSGDLDAAAVQVQQAKVSVAGSGNVKAHATGTADVDIMGSGDVDVTGGAKCKVSKAGSGDVRCS